MKEFLIRREDNDFCIIHACKFEEVLRPNSIKSEKVAGWGDYRIKADGNEVSFSFEEVGIQVSFENSDIDNEIAETIVSEICQNIEETIETACYWIQLSE